MNNSLKLPGTFPHEKYMRMALDQALLAESKGEVPTGCIIIQLGNLQIPKIIGKAHNQVELLKDPTAHAEILAITQAAAEIKDWRLTDTILYVTKEPCAMCAGAIILARIPVVVYAVADKKRGGAESVFNILNNPNLNHRCHLIKGVLGRECLCLLQSFFKEKRH